MLITILGFTTLQSCKKDKVVTPQEYLAAMPEAPVPAVDEIIPFTGAGQTINLTWAGTATDAIKWNVYFGDKSTPPLVATAVTANAYTATIQKGGTYYWGVVTVDNHNVESESALFSFQVNSKPGAPGTPAPALNATAVSCNPALSWVATDPEGDDLTYDLYLGTSATPTTVAATGLTAASFTVSATLVANTDYYWKVVAHDPFGGSSESPVWKFTTGSLPVSKFVGAFTADEPAEAYTYGVNFALVDAATIKCDNYWNSGWVVNFKLDLTKLTYTFPTTTFQTGWTGTESGIIDMATGTMTGTYTIWHNGAIAEQGVHTYTKN